MNWLADLPDSDWWEFLIAVSGALVGAFAGSLGAAFQAKAASKEASRKHEEAELRKKKAKIFRVFSVYIRAFNSFGNTYRMIFGMLDGQSSQLGDNAPNQRVIRVIANLEAEQFLEIDSDDIAVFFEAQRDDFVTDMLQSIEGYNAILNNLKTFNRLKEEIFPFLLEAEVVSISKSGAVTSKADDDLKRKLLLLEARAESVITPTLDHMRDLLADMLDLADQFPIEAKQVIGEDSRVPGIEAGSLAAAREEFCLPKKT